MTFIDGASQTGTSNPRNRAIVVIGPGRSGTSVLTAGIGALGAYLGENLKPGGVKKNPKGFFEDMGLLDINHRLHRAFGLAPSGANVRLVDDRLWQTIDSKGLEQEAVALIRSRFGDRPLWGMKSGGLLRLLPFWQAVFKAAGVDVGYVLAIRNPLGVADSRANLDHFRGFQEKSDLEWLAQAVQYFDRLQGCRLVAVDYDQLMQDPAAQLRRVEAGLALPASARRDADIAAYSETFATKSLYHHRHSVAALDANDRLNPLTRDTYRALYSLATDQTSTQSPEFWETMTRIQADYRAMAPTLRYLDHLEDELRGRYLGLSGLWHSFAPRMVLRARKTAKTAG